jgi:DNA-binding PadR family transcriptional regulator
MQDLPKDLIAASSIPLLLTILQKGESYGYEIIKMLKEKSGGKLDFAEGTLYPILKKMEEKGWLTSTWKKADNERERKYYQLTTKGKKQLILEKENWTSVNLILQNLWQVNINIA